MLQKSNLCVLIAILLLVSPVFALTAKIGNPRAVVYAQVTPSKPAYISRTLEVINVNDVAVNIVMDVSENCKDMIKVRDQEDKFTLQPDQSKNVPYTIKATQAGLTECRINTYFTIEGDKGPGVVLSSVITVNVKGEGPKVQPADNSTAPDGNSAVVPPDDEITGGVSVNPGGKPNLENNEKPSLNVFAIGFFVLMLVVVILLAIVVVKRRRRSGEDEIKK